MYTHLFVAGTFDHFHTGHETLLRSAIDHGKEVTIGITSDIFVKKYKNRNGIQPFSSRKKQIESWLSRQPDTPDVNIIPIEDPFEPAASGNYDALIVTEQNKQTGEEINARRLQNNLPALILLEVPLRSAYDSKPISSTRIRSGEIDTQGNLYLPESLRASLQQPFGPIITPESLENISGKTVISVGDITTDMLLSKGILPDLSIIDFHAQRKPYKQLQEFSFPEDIVKQYIVSGPGFISGDAITAIRIWSSEPKKTVIVISGEDDLLVLPAIIYAPDGSYVLYGQPNEGLVKVIVNTTLKEKAREYIEQFEQLQGNK